MICDYCKMKGFRKPNKIIQIREKKIIYIYSLWHIADVYPKRYMYTKKGYFPTHTHRHHSTHVWRRNNVDWVYWKLSPLGKKTVEKTSQIR